MKKLLFAFISLLCLSPLAHSKDIDCLEIQNDMTLMIQVRDYSAMLKAADLALKNCKAYMEKHSTIPHLSDMEGYYKFYGLKAEAYLGLGKFEEALKTSQECIDKRYSTVDCHLSKWKSLFKLGRYEEAREFKKTLYFIIQNKIDLVNQIDISIQPKVLQPLINEQRRSEIGKLNAYKEFLDRSD
jgi:tetratricopeptide (TPR) repeat protein